MQTTAAESRTVGHQPERDRLERRAVRVRQVLHALRERAAALEGEGEAPRPLVAAIEEFDRELSELERFCLCWLFPEEIKGSVEQLELLIAAQQCRSGRVPKILPAPDIDMVSCID